MPFGLPHLTLADKVSRHTGGPHKEGMAIEGKTATCRNQKLSIVPLNPLYDSPGFGLLSVTSSCHLCLLSELTRSLEAG